MAVVRPKKFIPAFRSVASRSFCTTTESAWLLVTLFALSWTSIMSFDAINGRNLLLDIPGELLRHILGLYDAQPMVRVLWMTGSKTLHTRMRRWTSAVRVEAEGKVRTFVGRSGVQTVTLPACFAELSQLESLTVFTDNELVENIVIDYADVLKNLNPGLKRLDLTLPLNHNVFKQRVPPPAPEARKEDGNGHNEEDGNGDGGYGRHGGAGRRERANKSQGVRNRDGSGAQGRSGSLIGSTAPKVEESLIDLSATFPHLEFFGLSLGPNPDSDETPNCDPCLPPGLISLRCDFPTENERLLDCISHLPTGLTELDYAFDPPNLTATLLSMLPQSIAFLGMGYIVNSVEAFEALPRSTTSLGGATYTWDDAIARATPPLMRKLELYLYEHTSPLNNLPPMLTSLRILSKRLSAADVQLLPRTITKLRCTLTLTEQTTAIMEFPPNLKKLSLRPAQDEDPKKKRTELNELARLLPRTLETLQLFYYVPDSQFYGLLPKGLKTIFTTANTSEVDPNRFSLPPRLTSLTLGGTLRRDEKNKNSERLKDMDAWTKQDSLDVNSGLLINPHAPEDILKPFPYHILPRTLIRFSYTQRPTPISSLQFLPLLLELSVLEFVEDAKYDPVDSVLVSKANELRQFGESLSTRSQLALNPLTRVCALDLLPRSLTSLGISFPDPNVDENEWQQRFPSLRRLSLGRDYVLGEWSE